MPDPWRSTLPAAPGGVNSTGPGSQGVRTDADAASLGAVTGPSPWQPPPLPASLTDPVRVIAVGTAAWLVALAVLGVLALTGSRPADAWLVACAIGAGLGLLGLGVFTLQRRANARGDKGAQRL